MKVCVTSQGDSLKSQVDPRFGRCPYFIIADLDDIQGFTAAKNPNVSAFGGAGVQAGKLVLDNKAEVVLTGNIGPNAFRVLQEARIKVATNINGTVEEALSKCKEGKLDFNDNPSVNEKHGLK